MINPGDEYAIVVDDQDNVITYKKRRDLKSTDRIRVTGVWIENSAGKVLIAQRSYKKELHPGLWGPAAAGGVAKGESYEENAYKELEEEVGLTNIPLELVDSATVDHSDGTRRYAAWFKGYSDTAIADLTLEDAVETVKWVDKKWLAVDLKVHPEKYVPSAVEHWHQLFLFAD